MGLLSFFGSAKVNLKILQCKPVSMATTEMSQLNTIVTALPSRLIAMTKHFQSFRRDSQSFLFR
jgi:hypothetical protein